MAGERTFIYALADPDTQEVRYIGKADNPQKRLKRHIAQYEPKATHKSNWIRSLLDQGKTPALLVLEEAPRESWQECERKWITHYKGKGARLTNTTAGGEGGKTLSAATLSPEERARRSQSARERMQKMWDEIKAERAIEQDRMRQIQQETRERWNREYGWNE